MAKKVLVVGGSGFLGSHVADELTEKGYEVTIFDQKKSTWINDNQKFIESDLLDREHVCLLYTSPSPRDRTRSRMPSSA